MFTAQPAAPVTFTDLAAVLGMVLGTAGFVMSLMNYLRDRPRVRVSLHWDMSNTATGEKMGLIRVVNIGRRPIFISIAALELPSGFKHSHLVISDSIKGKKLSEGDGAEGYLVNYKGLQQYAGGWRNIRAYAEDTAAGKYYSKKVDPKVVPSWVLGEHKHIEEIKN